VKEDTLTATTVGQLLEEGSARLRAAGVSNAEWEAREMMAAVLKELPALLPLRHRSAPETTHRTLWHRLVDERCSRKPLAQVLGEWDFHGMRLHVTPDVLIPRPETEELLERALKLLPGRVFSIADVGTGSGCLAIALAKRFPDAFVWALDVSPQALAVARRNAELQRAGRRVFFLEGDLLSRLPLGLALDVVVANLPYVDEKDMDGLDPEVKHEPSLALNGGRGGLDLIRRLVVQAWERLLPGGSLFLEVGHDQAAEVSGLLQGMGFKSVSTGKDFAGVDRFVSGVR
jgi:release factor glutamine methyltransferase